MAKDHGPSINDDETCRALREDSAWKEKAARIGIDERSDMTKEELIKAIRSH